VIRRLVSPALSQLLTLAPPRLKRRLGWLLICSTFGGIAELFTVGAVIPLLVAASDPPRLGRLPVVGHALARGLTEFPARPVVACAILLSVFGILAAGTRLLVLWLSQEFVYGLHRSIVLSMYSGILYQPYEWFSRNNGAEFAATLDKVFAMSANMLISFVSAVPAILMSVAILAILLLLSPAMAISIALILGGLYFGLALFALRSVDQLSLSAVALRNRRTRFAQETWGAARDIIIDGSQSECLGEATKLEDSFADIHVRASLIGLAPKIIVDAAILLLVAAITAILASKPADLLLALPVLAAFAIGGQRLIPLLQQIYVAYANQKIYLAYIDDALAYARLKPRPAALAIRSRPVEFKVAVELRNVSFTYAAGRAALRDINLSIRCGSKVGLVGKTGSGKSTLADIIMGLLTPFEGELLIDGVPLTANMMADWHAKIAHVPQSIFLADDSLLANVAFAARNGPVDAERAQRACVTAGLGDFVAASPDGLMRRVGERGIQLSGGQRQRIGIARALYKGAELLVLDEATSALDVETEEAILDAIFGTGNDLTIVMISHRATPLDRCDDIIRIRNGQIVQA